jgi:hypothetical protein
MPESSSPEYFLALAKLCEDKASLAHFEAVRQTLLDLAAQWRAQFAQAELRNARHAASSD